MRSSRVWARVVGIEHEVVVEGVSVDERIGEIVVACRPRRGRTRRCGRSGRRCPRYDSSEGRRRWRAWTRARHACLSRPTRHLRRVVGTRHHEAHGAGLGSSGRARHVRRRGERNVRGGSGLLASAVASPI